MSLVDRFARQGTRRQLAVGISTAAVLAVVVGVMIAASIGKVDSTTPSPTLRPTTSGPPTARMTSSSTTAASSTTVGSGSSAPNLATTATVTSPTAATGSGPTPTPPTAPPSSTPAAPAATDATTTGPPPTAPPTSAAPQQTRVRGATCSNAELGQRYAATDGGTVTCVVDPNGINPHWR